jgi:hypothetical protein
MMLSNLQETHHYIVHVSVQEHFPFKKGLSMGNMGYIPKTTERKDETKNGNILLILKILLKHLVFHFFCLNKR